MRPIKTFALPRNTHSLLIVFTAITNRTISVAKGKRRKTAALVVHHKKCTLCGEYTSLQTFLQAAKNKRNISYCISKGAFFCRYLFSLSASGLRLIPELAACFSAGGMQFADAGTDMENGGDFTLIRLF